jgi:predicted TPR repeat methyltransferase
MQPMLVTATEREEEVAAYYDDVYKDAYRTGIYNTTRFNSVYDVVLSFLSEPADILEIGCGVGELGRRLVMAGHRYKGFDFSAVALGKHSLSTLYDVWHGDAYDFDTWLHLPFDTVVAVETFEHLDDLYILNFVPPAVHVVFSVPDFDSRAHLRIYPDEKSIRAYYKDVLKIHGIQRLDMKKDKAIFVCNAVRM